jgi:hypothetical protein
VIDVSWSDLIRRDLPAGLKWSRVGRERHMLTFAVFLLPGRRAATGSDAAVSRLHRGVRPD